MKNILFCCLAVAAAAPALAGDSGEKKIGQAQARGIAEQLMLPVRSGVMPAVNKAGQDLYEAQQYSNGASWALWDLVKDISEKRKHGAKAEPDAGLIETYMRLRMRCNTADLCMKPGPSCKEYPGDADFSRAAKTAGADIRAYLSRMDFGEDPLKRQHRMRIESCLETARKRALFSLPRSASRNPRPSAPAPAEIKYRELALKKKQGNRFLEPSWP